MSELDAAETTAEDAPPPLPEVPEPVGEPQEAPEAVAGETAADSALDDDAEPAEPEALAEAADADADDSAEPEEPEAPEEVADVDDTGDAVADDDVEPEAPAAAHETADAGEADGVDADGLTADDDAEPEEPEAPDEVADDDDDDAGDAAADDHAEPEASVAADEVADVDDDGDDSEADDSAEPEESEAPEDPVEPEASAAVDEDADGSAVGDHVEPEESDAAPDDPVEPEASAAADEAAGVDDDAGDSVMDYADPQGFEVSVDSAEPEPATAVNAVNADSLPGDSADDQADAAEPSEAAEGDPHDLADRPADSAERGEPAGDGEPREASAREEGPEGGVLGRLRDAVSWWKDPTDKAVDIHATVDRPDFTEVTRAGEYRYGTPLDGPDGKHMPLFDGPPAREQTQQGSLGDCGIISTMGAVAGHRPEAISDRIRENDDGTYEVTLHQTKRSLYGDWSRFEPTGAVTVLTVTPDLPISVDSPDRPAYAKSGAGDAAWVPILEKAIAGVDETWDESRPKPVEGYVRLDQGSFPNHRAELLTQLTGEPAYTDDFPTQYDIQGRSPDRQLVETLRGKLGEGCPVLVGTVSLELDDDRDLPKGLIDSHAYEVTEVDDRGLVHLRNPHNSAHPDPLTVKEFRESIKNRYTTMGQT
ncbi:C2 family cysteine protease [Streptomyces sp. ISL-94]|uniref:C2 family cysteine protease n=1 Tax=Streptomyces sp. ISL-94 TaxID=2819190 RepID=UPI001BE7777E|nr:C2 family cysteine protease [Streptomyces sp. ISL-94]MBT2479822.1 hypothetical protein [Streptomyces sp. ISL-94]